MVLVVCLIIWIALFTYIFYLDSEVKKIKRRMELSDREERLINKTSVGEKP